VIENLGKGFPIQSKNYSHIQDLRWQLITAECNLKLRRPHPTVSRVMTQMKYDNQKKVQIALQLQEANTRLMQQAEYMTMIKKQFDELLRDQNKQKELLPVLLRELMQEEPKKVVRRFLDPDSFVRCVAVYAAAKRWMPVEKDLIDLLSDPQPCVREAARHGLVRLSRGNDFGPIDLSGKASQIEQAQAQWQRWLALQVAQLPEGSRNK
jgi:hypothetical protein